jgi:ABC-2 type transport system permease protein
MNRYLPLLKTLFICGSNMTGSETSGSKWGGKYSGLLSGLLTLVVFIPILTPIVASMRLMYSLLAANGTQDTILSLAISFALLTCIITGFSTIIIYFYTTTDLPTLLALPLTPSVIVAAKFTLCLTQTYLYAVLTAAPMLIAYGLSSGGNFLYWFIAVIVFLILPVMPLSYAGIIAMAVMRFFRSVRNKNVLTILCFIVSYGMSIFIILLQQGSITKSAEALTSASGRLHALFLIFPNAIFAQKALAGSDPVQLLLYLLVTAAAVAVFLLAAKLLYFKGAVGMTETSAGRDLTKEEASRQTRQGSFLKTCAAGERKKILRNPTVLVYGMQMDIMLVIVAAISLFTGNQSSGEDGVPLSQKLLNLLTVNASKPASLGTVFFISILVILILAAGNYLPASAISREGKGFFVMKTIPVSYTDQIRAKIRATLPFGFLAGTALSLVLWIICILHGMPPLILLYSLAFAVPGVITVAYIQIFFDLAYPKLIWETEAKAINGLHQTAGSAVGFLPGLTVVIIGQILYHLLKMNFHAVVLIMFLLMTGTMLLVKKLVSSYAEKRLQVLS